MDSLPSLRHGGTTLMTRLWLTAALCLAASWTPGFLTAQSPENSSSATAPPPAAPRPTGRARMPVQVIAGRLVVRCDVSTRVRRIPTNLLVDFDRACGFELHNKAADGIKVDANGGLPITIHLPGFNIVVPRREHGDEDFLDGFTKFYSKELGETACVGAIGAHILRNYHVTFDLEAGFVFLEAPREKDDTPPAESERTTVHSITLTNNQVWLPVRFGDKVMAMNLATSRYDSLVDEDICEAEDKPAGDIGAVLLKTRELTKFVALRPAALAQVHPDGALGTLGLNFLEHFRVEVDRVNRFVTLEQVKPAVFPAGDVEFFRAMVEEDPDLLRAYLKKHSQSRLAREASTLLVTTLLDSNAPAKDFDDALEWVDNTRIPDLRSTEALDTMKMLLEAQRPKLAIRAGKLGVVSGRKDRYPESVHKLHSKLGELLLDAENGDAAWEHLLSAAFGLPQDGMINLNLGRFYEQRKRYKRATSRYIQAVIQPESGALAVEGLERVQKATGGEPLSVDLVDKLIAGKVYNFGAATEFEPDAKTDTNRVVLVELFTNPHLGQQLNEGWRSFNVGGVMGQEGLLSHFPRSRVAVLTYFVDDPEPCALINALGMETAQVYGDTRPIYMMVNGVRKGPGAGRARKAEQIYETNRRLVMAALKRPSDYTLTGSARIEKTDSGHRVRGTIKIEGPEDSRVRVQVILAERGVLYPGKGMVVVHRMVARGSLTATTEGARYEPQNGAMDLPFAKSLEAIKAENEAFLVAYEKRTNKSATRLSTKIDPRQVSIVAVVRDGLTNAVQQALQIHATMPEESK